MNFRVLLFLSYSFLFFAFPAHAQLSGKLQSQQELNQALQVNQFYQKSAPKFREKFQGHPALETEHFRYLLMKGNDTGVSNLNSMHEAFARNLPKDMILVVVAEAYDVKKVKQKFLQWLPASQLKVASGTGLGDILWGRDSYPYPVYNGVKENIELVAHKYFRPFNAAKAIAQAVGSKKMTNPNFVAVGGNLMATEKGECFIVESDRAFGLEDITYINSFRCRSVVRFPYLAGIGDVDEVIKVLPNNVVLTNQPSYEPTLESLGYSVKLLPSSKTGRYRTYANSVILEDTVFMPVFGDPEDEIAKKVYEDFGYKVVGIPSNYLSDKMLGSVHCLTMAYPETDLQVLLNSVGLSVQ